MQEHTNYDKLTVFSRVFLAITMYIVVSNLAGTAISLLMHWSMPFVELIKDKLMLVNGLLTLLLVFPVTALLFRGIPVLKAVRVRELKPVSILKLFTICYAGMFIGNYVSSLFLRLMNMGSNNYIADLIISSDVLQNLLFVAILAPVLEELIFRKLVIDRLAVMGDRSAAFMSALIFALMHGNFFQFFYAFIVGYIFAVIYINTGKISYTILIHIIINFMGSVASVMLLKAGGLVVSVYGLMLIGIVITGIYYLLVFIKDCRPADNGAVPAFSGEWYNFIFSSHAFNIFLIISLAISFYRTGR